MSKFSNSQLIDKDKLLDTADYFVNTIRPGAHGTTY